MADYHISELHKHSQRDMKKLDALLQKEGIERDKNLDYMAGLYDEDYHLAATGSCFGTTLRCMAVDSSHQGEGLLNQIVTHLIEYQYAKGNTHLFLYTKCDKALFFRDLGFYEIARVEGKVVFMENRRGGFSSYLENLKQETDRQAAEKKLPPHNNLPAGAVIMNANPFTLGHRYLIEKASAACGLLHVFVVSEDVSLVPFDVRFSLVKKGTADLKNIICHKTGDYMISNATFPSYFLKDEDTVIRSHAALDIAVFRQIASFLRLTVRFVGEEPKSQVTGIYNQVMEAELKRNGLDCRIIPRLKDGGKGNVISASTVRKLVQENRISAIQDLVPAATYEYFTSPEAADVIKVIQEEENVIHY